MSDINLNDPLPSIEIKPVIIQSFDDYDRGFPISNEYGVVESEITFPAKDKYPANVIEISGDNFDYLKKTFKLFGQLIEGGKFRILDTMPINYLDAAGQISQARQKASEAEAKTADAVALAAAKDDEIAKLKAMIEGMGGPVQQ